MLQQAVGAQRRAETLSTEMPALKNNGRAFNRGEKGERETKENEQQASRPVNA
jgi:hypothetical protein